MFIDRPTAFAAVAPVRPSGGLRRVSAVLAVAAVCVTASSVWAQAGLPVLTSPLGTAPAAPAKDGPSFPGAVAPAGQGAGQHSPNSPFAPLPLRSDVVPWSMLTDVKLKTRGGRPLPDFPDAVRAMNGTVVRVQGFMMPLAPGEKQTHFLVTSVPLTCSFCTPGGPESMLEVRTRAPVKYGMEPVVVEGRFQVLEADPMGIYYRMTSAVAVK